MTAHDAALGGESVKLVPLAPEHIPALMLIARKTPAVFELTSTPITDEERDRYFEEAFRSRANGIALPYAIVRTDSNIVVGTSRINDLDLRNKRCSIGYTWLSPDHHGDGTNLESKLLLLKLAFDTLGVNRVQFQVDERNTSSRRAVERLGATQEGRLRLHLLAKDGTYRNSIIYSIVLPEWAAVKEGLQQRIMGRPAKSAD
jgi:RimJ/RimL family protein N-acetyltransferase